MLEKVPHDGNPEYIECSKILNYWSVPGDQSWPGKIEVHLAGGLKTTLWFRTIANRDSCMDWLANKRKGEGMKDLFADLKGYLKENRDFVYTVLFALIIDEYVFQGAFRERIKGIVEGMLTKVEKKVIPAAPEV